MELNELTREQLCALVVRYKAALEAIVATDVPRIDEGDVMVEIAQEALDG